eukprot:GHVQ01015856.1.p1 GENE.GHVQ01015856.1~~GHVQ01015856.1.p1  ORF type:complete len:129 (-),score=18.80 GHVQ01015856.1:266-652(-)
MATSRVRSSSQKRSQNEEEAVDNSLLFEDRFMIRSVDWNRFENVLRMRGKSSGYDADLILDVHSHLFPVKNDESVYLGLTTSVSNQNTGDEWLSSNTILEDYDYVMYGRAFKIEDKTADRRNMIRHKF